VPNLANAHPHLDETASIAIVHNGIIENYSPIRLALSEKGVSFASDTDSEVIAQLISHVYKGDLKEAVQKAASRLHGSFAIAAIHKDHPDEIVVASRENPIVIGIDSDAIYLASDPNAFMGKSLDVLYLGDDEIAHIRPGDVDVFTSHGQPITKPRERIGFEDSIVSKNGYDHFMLKEIHEQPQTIQRAMDGRLSEEFGTAVFEELGELQSITRILILGCGTSWHAGSVARSLLENIARIPTEVEIASEFRYTNPIISENTLVVAISQSGETADTVAAVREAKAKGAHILAMCNVKNSTLTRIADYTLFLNAGPEISVCSTKAFTSQLTLLTLFTLCLARQRHMSKEVGRELIRELKHLPTKVTQVLSQSGAIEDLAYKYSWCDNFCYLGRRYMHPASLEAALKLKEISYINATGYPAGEMKHGPIALVCPELVTIGMCGNTQTFDKMTSNLMEVRSRGGPIIAFAPKGAIELKEIADDIIWLPKTSDELAVILYSVAAQLFAYFLAKTRGTDIDQPRNLAKSVTVE
jgi:glucosamine--fructose-6-phosphate aminotransferase (isomerizing)